MKRAFKHSRVGLLQAGVLLSLVACALPACGEEDGKSTAPDEEGERAAVEGAGARADAGAAEADPARGDAGAEPDTSVSPVYAIMYEVYDDVGSTSYLNLVTSLEIERLDLSKAHEYGGGRAFLETYDGAVYVGDPSAPVVTRYVLDDAGRLEETGRVSFAQYGLTSGSIGSWSTNFISPTKAYHFDHEAVVAIVWNPTTMEITGEIELPKELDRKGYSLDGSPGVVRGDRLFRTFYWVNWDTAEYSADQLLAIFDVESDQLLELVPEDRCPASGNLVHRDEPGNFYFSNWIWPISGTLLNGAPENCVLRLPADGERFDDWTLTYADLFGGREGAMFTYTGDDTALVSVFHDEEVDYGATTDPWELASNPSWRVWSVDLASDEVSELAGVPPNTGAFTPVNLDGRQFLMVPGEGWATTDVYEVAQGRAELAFEIPGWSYQFRKLR